MKEGCKVKEAIEQGREQKVSLEEVLMSKIII